MPNINILVHMVWATKRRRPVLKKEVRKTIFEHILENARAKGIYVLMINGYLDHVHCLISISSGQNIDWIAQALKGESAFWINKNKIFDFHFEWQIGYGVFSVSPDRKITVLNYIRNQEEHHSKNSPGLKSGAINGFNFFQPPYQLPPPLG